MKITVNKSNLINNFLSPISKISDECSIIINHNNLSSLISNQDTSIICYVKTNAIISRDTDEQIGKINIKDIKKLIKIFECIPEDNITFELSDNFSLLKYKSKTLSFKFHLMNDTVIRKTVFNIDKIQNLKFTTEFILPTHNIKDILQGSVFVSNVNKVYFYCKDNNIYAEITDKNLVEVDNVEFLIGTTFTGEVITTPLPFNLDYLRILNSLKSDNIKVKINNEFKILLFEINTDDIIIKYIVPTYTK